jgi:hypothetical protein
VASHPMIRRHLAPLRDNIGAVFFGNWAARVEAASAGWSDRAGDVAGQDGPAAQAVFLRIGDGDCRKERLGIRMERVFVEPLDSPSRPSPWHDRYAVTNMSNHARYVTINSMSDRLVLQSSNKLQPAPGPRLSNARSAIAHDKDGSCQCPAMPICWRCLPENSRGSGSTTSAQANHI